MNKEVAIILASHGEFAKEALKSLEMIAGDMQNIATLSLFPGTSLADFVETIELEYEKLDTTNGLIIICDIFGGTPSNAATTVLLKHSDENIVVYAGLNLGVLLELSSSRNREFADIKQTLSEFQGAFWKELSSQKKEKNDEEEL